MNTGNLIIDRSFQFSLEIVEFTEQLDELRKYSLSKQLFRSGTSIGANARESQYAESTADFIHKLKISEKEADETLYWLQLCRHSKNYPDPGKLMEDVMSLKRILGKIISSTKKNH